MAGLAELARKSGLPAQVVGEPVLFDILFTGEPHRSMGHLVERRSDGRHLIRTVRLGLRKIQYRPALLEGCLAETGLTLHPAKLATTTRVQAQ